MNKLSLNFLKTKYMIFGTNNTINKFQNIHIQVNDFEIERVQKFKYLSVILDPKLRFNEHMSYIRSKVLPRLKMLEKLWYTLGRNVKPTLYKKLIRPLFDYADVVYNCLTQMDTHLLQKLQNSALRLILNCDWTTRTEEMHKELYLDFLRGRCLHHSQAQVYKCLNGLAPKRLAEMMMFRSHDHCMTTRS